MNKFCLPLIFTSMCIALSACNLINMSSSSDESSSASDSSSYDALNNIVKSNKTPARKEISEREFYEMCELKDVSKCPIDPETNKVTGSCSTVRSACDNAVLIPREIPEYDNPEKLYEHMMRTNNSDGLGNSGYYLVNGEIENTKSSIPKEKYLEVRRKHIKEIFYHYQNKCSKGESENACASAQKIYKNDYSLLKKFFPTPSPLWPKLVQNPTADSSYTDDWSSNNKYFEASSNFCSGIQVYKAQIAVALGEPVMGLYVLSRTSTTFSVEEVNINRRGYISSETYKTFKFGDRQLVSIGNPIEAEILTDWGVCKFGWNE